MNDEYKVKLESLLKDTLYELHILENGGHTYDEHISRLIRKLEALRDAITELV